MGLEFGPDTTFPKNTWSYYFNTVTYRGKFNTVLCLGSFYVMLGVGMKLRSSRKKRILAAKESAAAAKN